MEVSIRQKFSKEIKVNGKIKNILNNVLNNKNILNNDRECLKASILQTKDCILQTINEHNKAAASSAPTHKSLVALMPPVGYKRGYRSSVMKFIEIFDELLAVFNQLVENPDGDINSVLEKYAERLIFGLKFELDPYLLNGSEQHTCLTEWLREGKYGSVIDSCIEDISFILKKTK